MPGLLKIDVLPQAGNGAGKSLRWDKWRDCTDEKILSAPGCGIFCLIFKNQPQNTHLRNNPQIKVPNQSDDKYWMSLMYFGTESSMVERASAVYDSASTMIIIRFDYIYNKRTAIYLWVIVSFYEPTWLPCLHSHGADNAQGCWFKSNSVPFLFEIPTHKWKIIQSLWVKNLMAILTSEVSHCAGSRFRINIVNIYFENRCPT